MKLELFTFSFNNKIRNVLEKFLFLSVHDIEFGISRFLCKTLNIIRIDHMKMSLIVGLSFINQTGQMFIALNFDKYYK